MESHWGNRDPVAKGGDLKGANAKRGTRMRTVEFGDEVWCLDIALVLPGVLFVAIALPLDEELEPIRSHATIQHPFNFEVFLTLTKHRWRWGHWLSARDGVVRSQGQIDNWEDRVQATQGLRKAKAIGLQPHPTLYCIGPKSSMSQLLRRTSGVYVTGIKIDLVARCEDGSRFALAVVVR
jgi:hypothetical protein